MERKKQIFFLHFAGGSCQSYSFLSKSLEDLEMHQLELPGRGRRAFDPFVETVEAAADDYVQQITKLLSGEPFVIYGHSMGALIGVYVAQRLERLTDQLQHLIVSGNAGPGIEQDKKRHLLQGEAFLEELKLMGGMPAVFFEDQDLIDFFSPVLRADFKLVEEESKKTLAPIATPIFSLVGDQDANGQYALNWKQFTQAKFEHRVFKGGHFFIHQHVNTIAGIIKDCFSPEMILK